MCNEIKATVTERRWRGIEFSTEIEDMDFDAGINEIGTSALGSTIRVATISSRITSALGTTGPKGIEPQQGLPGNLS